METVYAGLDVGSTTCHLAVMDKEGTLLVDREIATSEEKLIDAVKGLVGNVRLHMEAGELAWWIRGTVKRFVAEVIVGDSKRNAWIAKDPLKGDPVDAGKLADLLRMGRTHPVYYADEDHRALFKQVVQHYDDVTSEQVRMKNKIKSKLRGQGVVIRGARVFTSTGREKVLKALRHGLAREVLKQLFGLLDQALEEQGNARKLMQGASKRYEEIARFQQVPGVGLIGACRFSGYIQTPHRFSSKRKLWRYSRLGITDRRSDGKPLGKQKLDRNGNPRLKAMSRTAFIAAMKTKKDNTFKRTYRKALSRTHNQTHARLTVQRKILATLLTMWREEREYEWDKG